MFHENQLLETLVGAERAWAHASELKSLLHERLPKSHEKANCAPGRIRQHSVRRLRRARQLAIDFRDLCGEFADETTRVEAAAYAAWMSGNLALELNDWKVSNVATFVTKSKTLY
jgi:signal recognition particle subunit SRP68